MVAVNKFNVFTKDLVEGSHDFTNDTFKALLTNTAPVATNTVKANITEITAGNGYTSGGEEVTMAVSTATGTAKVTATDVEITATGAIGPFRYVVIYNDTTSSPAKPLVGWIDYGSAITMTTDDTFTIDFDGTNGFFTLA